MLNVYTILIHEKAQKFYKKMHENNFLGHSEVFFL